MCTLTWVRPSPDAYTVLFNRDEQRSRAVARPPQEQAMGEVRYLAPIDSAAGGTWIAANERGLTLALLNFYDAQPAIQPAVPRSRGHIIPALMDLADVASVTLRLSAESFDDFLPFILVAFDQQAARAHRWDGHVLHRQDVVEGDGPISTSAFAPAAVAARRLAGYRRMCAASHIDAALLEQYHRSTDPEVGAYSVCMTRPDAHTVSFSRVTVTTAQIEFLYEPRADGCAVGASITSVLARA